ncbi:MAG: metal-dependent hydrolase [Candidatus Nitrosocaldus sp.]|nr:metal-dependent hydrolase [Candidatus Nitrosocaldus sp.]MDW7999949.1 metal-dependent hydrolase [Candidatus Nitrosocaldus sp.]
MFLVGHAAWAYVISRPLASVLRVKINPYLVMLLGMIPDVDILLQEYIKHRSVTHSVLFWGIAFIPLFIMYRRRSIPYFAAVIQHIIFGDVVVASTNILWPLRFQVGMGNSLLSPLNIAMEFIGMGMALLLILRYDKAMVAMNSRNILGMVVMLPLIGSMFYLFTTDGLLFLDHILGIGGISSKSIIRGVYDAIDILAIVLHISFAALLSASVLQGLRALLVRMH